jgi:hypothetical protein
MAQVIEGGPSVMNALIYGETHPSVMQYVHDAYDRVSARVNDVGRAMLESANNLYQATVSTSAYRLARAALRKLEDGSLLDKIMPLLTVSRLQNAPGKMVPWVMCEPSVKRKWLEGRCEGYGDEYVDVNDGKVGVQDSLWRAVYSGMAMCEGDVEIEDPDVAAEPNWGAVTYWDDDVEELNLSSDTQDDITATHDVVRLAMTGVDDPTSRWNAAL